MAKFITLECKDGRAAVNVNQIRFIRETLSKNGDYFCTISFEQGVSKEWEGNLSVLLEELMR